MCKVYGNAAIGFSAVKTWFALPDKPRSGRPKETEDEELQNLFDDVTQSNGKTLEYGSFYSSKASESNGKDS